MLNGVKDASGGVQRQFLTPDLQPFYLGFAAKPSQLSLRQLTRTGLDQGDGFAERKIAVYVSHQLAIAGGLHRRRIFLESARQQLSHFPHPASGDLPDRKSTRLNS